jgi:hypothetical protein
LEIQSTHETSSKGFRLGPLLLSALALVLGTACSCEIVLGTQLVDVPLKDAGYDLSVFTHQTMLYLQDAGVKSGDQLRFRFDFEASQLTEAESLEQALSKGAGLEVSVRELSSSVWAITGKTEPTRIQEPLLTSWAQQMLSIGALYNCKFKGWKTFVEHGE